MAIWKEVMAACVGAALALGRAVFASTTDFFTKDRAMDIQMLQIALDILREDPKESKIKAARGWAVDVINSSSEVQIDGAAREELIQHSVSFSQIDPMASTIRGIFGPLSYPQPLFAVPRYHPEVGPANPDRETMSKLREMLEEKVKRDYREKPKEKPEE